MGTGHRLPDGRVALAATRVQLPCPPLGTRPCLNVLDKRCIRHIIKMSGKRCSSISKPRAMLGALAFVVVPCKESYQELVHGWLPRCRKCLG